MQSSKVGITLILDAETTLSVLGMATPEATVPSAASAAAGAGVTRPGLAAAEASARAQHLWRQQRGDLRWQTALTANGYRRGGEAAAFAACLAWSWRRAGTRCGECTGEGQRCREPETMLLLGEAVGRVSRVSPPPGAGSPIRLAEELGPLLRLRVRNVA